MTSCWANTVAVAFVNFSALDVAAPIVMKMSSVFINWQIRLVFDLLAKDI